MVWGLEALNRHSHSAKDAARQFLLALFSELGRQKLREVKSSRSSWRNGRSLG